MSARRPPDWKKRTCTRARTSDGPPFIQAADPLRRRGRIRGRLHRDHFPRWGRLMLGAARPGSARLGSAAAAVRRFPGILELFNECVCCCLLLPPPLSLSPSPPLRAASHHYRLLLLLMLPSSRHADDSCHAALMTLLEGSWRSLKQSVQPSAVGYKLKVLHYFHIVRYLFLTVH